MKYFLTVTCGLSILLQSVLCLAENINTRCTVDNIYGGGNKDIYKIMSAAQGNPAVWGTILWASGAQAGLKCEDQSIYAVAWSCDTNWDVDTPRADSASRCAKQMDRDLKLFFYAQQSKLPIAVQIETRDNAQSNMCFGENGCPTKLIRSYVVGAPE